KFFVGRENDYLIDIALVLLGIEGQSEGDTLFLIHPEDERAVAKGRTGQREQRVGAHVFVMIARGGRRIESGDAFGCMKACGGRLDLKNFSLLEANGEVAPAVGVLGV